MRINGVSAGEDDSGVSSMTVFPTTQQYGMRKRGIVVPRYSAAGKGKEIDTKESDGSSLLSKKN